MKKRCNGIHALQPEVGNKIEAQMSRIGDIDGKPCNYKLSSRGLSTLKVWSKYSQLPAQLIE